MKLYYRPGACSMASHLVLEESGIKYAANLADFEKGEFEKINPKGYVPALQLDNGEVLSEGAVIMQWVADQAPAKNLLPKAGTWERYRCQEWLNYLATEIHKGFSPLWSDDTPEAYEKVVRATLAKKFDYLSQHLNKKSYLMGETYTVADAYLFTLLSWSKPLEFDLKPWPDLLGFMEKVQSRLATVKVLKDEGLLK